MRFMYPYENLIHLPLTFTGLATIAQSGRLVGRTFWEETRKPN